MMTDFDAIIIGGGASGLMCAIAAGQRGRRVLLLERAEKVGKKILISGGGRCNFTNLHVSAENYLSKNPHFCKSALSRFTPADFIALVEKHGIRYHEKTAGQLFCDGSAAEIVQMLLAECAAAGVEIQTGCTVESIRQDEVFSVRTNFGEYRAASLVIATGGLSIPKMGATDFGLRVAKQFGLKVVPPSPGLVGLRLGGAELRALDGLSGVSVTAEVSCGGQSFREAILFTHHGLSGPAILQISNYWRRGQSITINFLPDVDLAELISERQKTHPNATLKTPLSEWLPKRLVQRWLAPPFDTKKLKQLLPNEVDAVVRAFQAWEVSPTGTEGFKKAEVTRGGVDTAELSSKTFETKRVRGLFFIGETVDVTGWLGGYNFQWAWASGWCAGQFV